MEVSSVVLIPFLCSLVCPSQVEGQDERWATKPAVFLVQGAPATEAGDFRFEVLHESRKPGSRARVGRIHTPHGVIETPAFVPQARGWVRHLQVSRTAIVAFLAVVPCSYFQSLARPLRFFAMLPEIVLARSLWARMRR